MATHVDPIPKGFHTLTPYLVTDNAEQTIEFLKNAFGAKYEHEPTKRPDGKLMHATLKIGNSMFMIAEACGDMKAQPGTFYLYVPDADAAYEKAVKAGGKSIMEPAAQFYGDKSGGVKDPGGNSWFVSTHIEDVKPDEMQKRANEFFKKNAA